MAIYTDQTIAGDFDPSLPPPLPHTVVVGRISIDDADDSGTITAGSGDAINGSEVIGLFVGDEVVIDGVTVVGVTFYTADGSTYFTPSDGTILTDGSTVTDATWVNGPNEFNVNDLGPMCFVAGAFLRMGDGSERRVEDLSVGDLVLTRDHGAQPIRWIGRRTVVGHGDLAPVRIAAGAFGNPVDLLVSPQHRVLVEDWRAELVMGTEEVLCPAMALVDGDRIHRAPRPEVTYYHVMLDRHEVVLSNGVWSESFFVGDHLCAPGSALQRELATLFPEMMINPKPMIAARPVARPFEGRLLARL
ncbi:Hint domain-containing protein [Loktanella sp. IMCC34160]|uniref:Hint domain-containing protein n=1 Tax=Loktanella sp. IMCC34160 TaxID=2510646 RepID=UPI00101C3876|nr:Hint domain-containing protein [Loktanella sp. IMCC34160]RYG92321.1 Hint domain-containing protein [Loktanella sp. IMCC34160]